MCNSKYFIFSLFISVCFFVSCGVKAPKDSGNKKMTKVVKPCHNESKYMTSKKVFRASSVGKSMDQQTSKEKAILSAKADIADQTSSTLKLVQMNHVNSLEENNRETLRKKFERQSQNVVFQSLSQVSVICEETYKDGEDYLTYICMEFPAENLLKVHDSAMKKDTESQSNAYTDTLDRAGQIRVEYDAAKFREFFEAEMAKYVRSE